MKQQTYSGSLAFTTPRAVKASLLDNLITYGAYVALFCALFFATFSKGIAGLKPGELLLLGVVALIGLRRVILRDFTFITTPIDAGLLLLIAFGTFLPLVVLELRGLYITTDDFRALIGPVEYYLWYRALLEAIPLTSHLTNFLKVILAALGIVSLIGVLQIARFPEVEKLLVKYYPGHNVDLSQTIHRATSVVGSWETLAALAVYTLILVNQLLTHRASQERMGKYWNWLLIGLALISIGAMAATLSFAGFFGLGLSYILAWRLNGKLPRVTLAILGTGALALIALGPYLLSRIHAGGNTGLILQSWQNRALHWQIIYHVLIVNPQTLIFGVQPGFTYPVITFDSTESMYLLLLYRGGLLYLAAFITFFALVFFTINRARRASTGFEREVLTALLIIFLVHIFIDIVDAHLFDAGESQVLLAMLAIVAGVQLRTDRRFQWMGQQMGRSPVAASGAPPPGMSALGRSALTIAALASVVTTGLAWNYNRHLTPPPAALAVITYDQGSTTWLENQAIGTTSWMLDSGAVTDFLQGYAGAVSALPGQTVPLYVSSPRPVTFAAQVYRIGWYRGEGGHLMETIPGLHSAAQGTWTTQSGLTNCTGCVSDPTTHLLDAHWTSDASVTIGANWVTGMYLIKLSSTDGVNAESYIPLVVRTPSPTGRIIASIPMMSYAADNIWGGYSLDAHGTSDLGISDAIDPQRATQVSLNRPFVNSAGAGDFLNWEIHAVRWLERSAYAVDYTTDIDIAASGGQLNHNIYVSLGPDPYWTQSLRTTLITSLQKGGTSLEFYSAQNGYWQARLSSDSEGNVNRTLICYKVATNAPDPTQLLALDPLYKSDPTLVTARWSDPAIGLPESMLIGASYGGLISPTTAPQWSVRPNGPLDSIETLQTGLTPGLQLKAGILRYGFDTLPKSGAEPGGLNQLGVSAVIDQQGQPATAVTTFYFAATTQQALVFDAGFTTWDWTLDEFTFPGANLPNTVLGEQHLETMATNLLFAVLPAV